LLGFKTPSDLMAEHIAGPSSLSSDALWI
jgi:hypothetical protein